MTMNTRLEAQVRLGGNHSPFQGLYRLCLILSLLLMPIPFFAQGDKDTAAGAGGIDGMAVLLQQDVVLSSDNPWCLTDSECSFSVFLPEISPSQVGVGNPRLPEGVRFLAAYKDLSVAGSDAGTSIRVLLSFSQEGTFQLPPLDIMLDSTLYQLPFAPVEVFQNPRSLRPELQLSFQREDGQLVQLSEAGFVPAQTGKPLLLTVSLRYAVRLEDLLWQLVPDALFQQVEDFREEFNLGAAELSHQFQPVARFQLVPLRGGLLEVPPLELEVTGYDDGVHRLSTSLLKVESAVVPEAQGQDHVIDPALASAFVQPATEAAPLLVGVSLEAAQELAQLRRQERKSLPLASIRQNRILREQELGLGPEKNEASWPLVWILAGLGGLLLLLLVLSLLKKKYSVSAGFGFCLLLVTVGAIVTSRPLFQSTGILASRTLSKIPEVDAANHFSVAPYSLVEIRQEVMGWYYVSAGGLEGWIPRNQVIPIALEEK